MRSKPSPPFDALDSRQVPGDRSATVDILTRINVNDMLSALGLDRMRFGRCLLEWLCLPPARRFAEQVAEYDETVGRAGLPAGHEWLLDQFVSGVDVRGLEHIPRSGPLLIVANHPGQADGSALMARIPRPDLRIVSANHPFMRVLPHTAPYLFFIADVPAARRRLVREVADYLRSGGAVLIFPGGDIEPDPAVLTGAVEALQDWSASMNIFARLIPELTVVPAVSSGVLSRRALRHPLTFFRRDPMERRRLAAILQISVPAYHDVWVRLTFGSPIRLVEQSPASSGLVSGLVRAEVARLMRACRDTPPGM